MVRHMAQEQELVSTIARSDGQELVPIDTAELEAFLAMPVVHVSLRLPRQHGTHLGRPRAFSVEFQDHSAQGSPQDGHETR